MEVMTLSGKQLKEALEFINPDGDHDVSQLEDEVTFRYLRGTETPVDEDTQEHLPDGMYLCITDYPEEGWLGPLGVDLAMPNKI